MHAIILPPPSFIVAPGAAIAENMVGKDVCEAVIHKGSLLGKG
jgi:hypothetical protein